MLEPLSLFRLRQKHETPAEAGAFGRWGLRVGDRIEIRPDESDHR